LNNGDTFVGDFDQSKRTFGVYRWKEQPLQQQQHQQQEGTGTPMSRDINQNVHPQTIRKQRFYQGEFHEDGRPHGHGKYT
jgi:hypothetical protein